MFPFLSLEIASMIKNCNEETGKPAYASFMPCKKVRGGEVFDAGREIRLPHDLHLLP
jgi:hypothetical protein